MALTLTDKLNRKVSFALNQVGTRETARLAMNCLDLTALNGDETKAEILDLCDVAKYNQLAAVCVYPEHLATARKAIRDGDVAVATVINFPFGDKRTGSSEKATVETTQADITKALDDGANQIDIVLPHAAFLRGERNYVRDILVAAGDLCRARNATLKVILETAAFDQSGTLRFACQTAITAGAHCLKTSTGKHPKGGASMDAVAIMLDEISKCRHVVGIKVSGGVKTNTECAQYIMLARSVLGWDCINPRLFRIGSSSILPHLLQELAPTCRANAPRCGC